MLPWWFEAHAFVKGIPLAIRKGSDTGSRRCATDIRLLHEGGIIYTVCCMPQNLITYIRYYKIMCIINVESSQLCNLSVDTTDTDWGAFPIHVKD